MQLLGLEEDGTVLQGGVGAKDAKEVNAEPVRPVPPLYRHRWNVTVGQHWVSANFNSLAMRAVACTSAYMSADFGDV